MVFLKNLGSALLGCIEKPVDVLCEWASQPSKDREHKRNLESQSAEARAAHDMAKDRLKTESGLRQAEQKLDVELQMKFNESQALIDDMVKEKEFQRLQRTIEAIAKYQEQLTSISQKTITAIGHMQLELKERAQELVYEKTLEYKKLQDVAVKDAMAEFEEIEARFAGNERAQDTLIRAVDIKLGNVINSADRFLQELNSDIENLNNSINSLTHQGQRFIESSLQRLHVSEMGQIELQEKQDRHMIDGEVEVIN